MTVASLAVLGLRPQAAGPGPQAAGSAQIQRDAVAAPTGTGVIAGTVFTDEATPRPVRRASVMLASGELKFPQTVVTDDAGRFVFASLAAGNYTLVATKPGYVSASYGAKRPGRGAGVPIAVLDGQKVTDISLKMLHGGVITGTVRSVTGQPVPNLSVQVYQVDAFGGARHLSMAAPGNNATDDRGIYRVFGLAPGDYVVQIAVSPASSGMFGGDSRLVTPAEVQWAAPSGAPGAPGMTGVAALGPAPAPGQTVAYASLYFPGTADTNAASVITLGPEETRTGIDLTMAFVPTARIAGTVLDQDGRPMPGAQISLTSAGSSSDFARLIEGMARSMSRTGADGSFTITGVTPGQYAINARAAPRDAAGRGQGPGPGALLSVAGMMGAPGAASLWANGDLSVNGVDITDMVLRLQPGMNVSGKIVFDGSSAPPADVTKTRISLMPPPTGSSPIEQVAAIASTMLGGMQATVSADGTFVIKGVAPSKYRLTVTGQGIFMGQALPGSAWTLKSAMFNGRDVSDLPFELRPNEDVGGMIVTLTDRPTEISGSVVDRAGRPAPGFPIVVFSTDRAYWTVGSRRIQQVRPSSDGKYKLSGLPAGEYYVCAVTDLDQTQLYDPSALAALAAGSFKITLADGEKKVQDLRLAGGH
jgi:protocatechuate 3,4-dioxygenase beta subunit